MKWDKENHVFVKELDASLWESNVWLNGSVEHYVKQVKHDECLKLDDWIIVPNNRDDDEKETS